MSIRNQETNGRAGQRVWLYGKHSVMAALANPERKALRLIATRNCRNEMGEKGAKFETVDDREIAKCLPPDAVHQGMAGEFTPLPEKDLEEMLGSGGTVVLLDQVTDPHNVGAILRSASAFGALCVVMTRRNSPPESGLLAKAASGALEIVPVVRVGNLAETMVLLKKKGYWVAGLDSEAKTGIEKLKEYKPLALVLGAEGKGVRRLTQENCDLLVSIPIDERQESLNVSNAAAIALWESR